MNAAKQIPLTNQAMVRVAARADLSVATVRRLLTTESRPYVLTRTALLRALRALNYDDTANRLAAAWGDL